MRRSRRAKENCAEEYFNKLLPDQKRPSPWTDDQASDDAAVGLPPKRSQPLYAFLASRGEPSVFTRSVCPFTDRVESTDVFSVLRFGPYGLILPSLISDRTVYRSWTPFQLYLTSASPYDFPRLRH